MSECADIVAFGLNKLEYFTCAVIFWVLLVVLLVRYLNSGGEVLRKEMEWEKNNPFQAVDRQAEKDRKYAYSASRLKPEQRE